MHVYEDPAPRLPFGIHHDVKWRWGKPACQVWPVQPVVVVAELLFADVEVGLRWLAVRNHQQGGLPTSHCEPPGFPVSGFRLLHFLELVEDAAVVDPTGTAVGKYSRRLSRITAGALGAVILKALIERTGDEHARGDHGHVAQVYRNSEAPAVGDLSRF